MLNEFTSYSSNLDASNNDSTHKVRDRGYCPNGTDIGRPVAGSLPIPSPSSSWNYPYLSNLYNYYNPNSYELGNVPQYDNQKCSSQYVRNYNEHSSRFHSTSVLQCCDPRCQLIAKQAKYPYHSVNTKINQHPNKRTKNYYGSIVDLPKPDASVTGLAPSIEHTKYTPCVPYPTLRNDLNGKYSNQPSDYCSPFTNTLKRGADSTSFNEYYTDIGNPSYWNKPNSSIWNRNSSSYYPSTFEDKNTQKIDQGNFNSGSRGILFNRLLEHRDHPYDTGYTPNYYYGSKNDLNSNINYSQPNLPCEPVINDNRLPLQTNSYQPPPAYNIHYPSSQTIPQYYKENTQKRVPDAANQESRILDKNPNLDVREFLSTWEDDVDDEKVVEPTNESPVIVLDCSNLEGDVLAKVKEKLNSNSISNNDTAILKIVDVSNSGSATILSPHTSVIQENAVQSKEIIDKSSPESSHMNSDGCMTWYSNGKKKEDFSYDLVEMTERLVNTVGKLLSDPEKKVKPTSIPIKEQSPTQLEDSHSRLLPRPIPALPVLPNKWNPNSDIRKNVNIPNIPFTVNNGCLGNVSTANNASYNNYTSELDRNQQPLTEKNVSCTFNLRKTSNDLKFSVNYSTQQNDYNANKASDMSAKFKSTEFTQPYFEYNKTLTANPTINASNYKSYSTYSSYYENTGCNYDQTKLCNATNYNAGSKDNSMNYVDHIEKHAVSDTDITLVKADLEKSLNEISHTFKSNNNSIEKNSQYFGSNCINTTESTPKSDESFRCNERTKIIETQTYNGVIQKTGVCNSPLQKVDNCADNLLSMPSLSPPPNSLSTVTQPVISAPSISQNKDRPLCGINLTLNDVYENEDTIFNTSQETETNTFLPFCLSNQIPNDQTYQPLNLALSRDIKPQDPNFKDQQKIPECDEINKIIEGKTNSKADDGYYSVENSEADEIFKNNLKKSCHNPVSFAYHPCIVSHEQPKVDEIHVNNHSALETVPHAVSSHQNQQDIIVSDQPKIGENCTSNVFSSDNLKKSVIESSQESIDEISQGTIIPDKKDELVQIQEENLCKPDLRLEDNTDQNDTKSNYNSDPIEKLNEECDINSLHNSSCLDNIANTPPPHSEAKSCNHLDKITILDDVEKVKKTENESVQIQKYEQEDTALNLKVQPDILSCPILCGSVIKENENFIHHIIKDNNIILPCLENEPCEKTIYCAKKVPEPSHNSNISMNEKPSPQSVIVDYNVGSIEKYVNYTPKNDNLVEDKLKNDLLKRKLIDTSISNINLPMKKRKGQEYSTEIVKSLESTVTSSVLITSAENSAKNFHNFSVISSNHYEKHELISDIPRKNKKKRKKEKFKNNLKHKKYSKFKRHPLSKEKIKYQKKSHSFNKHEFLNSVVSEIIEDDNAISSSSSSPIYNNNDDIFNIPSVAPTPQFDLDQDFEPPKEQFKKESSANFNLNNNICKSEFINSSIDLHMLKAPSPNCVLQDDSFISEKLSSKAPSPYYDYNYEGMSPSSVAPSPNYDIIEGVLFDDTDSSRNNEDIDCKTKSNLELENVDKHADSQRRLEDFKRSTKYSITENEYESDYEIDRYYFKRKRDSEVERLLKKSKNFLKYNYAENKNDNYCNSKFSVNIFRHFDYAVDDERCIRSEDDEYEPKPNHVRHAFKPKFYPNCIKMKDKGKHIKKFNSKFNLRDKKRVIDSKCDLYFNKKKSTYISSPEYQLPVNVSSQCDKIISKFQMIEAPRSNLHPPIDITENDGIFKEKKLDCRSPEIISRDSSNGEPFSDTEGDEMVSSPAHTENIHSPISIMESDTEVLDFQSASKPDSNLLQNSQDMESPVDSVISKELNITENQTHLKSNLETEETDSPTDTMHSNHLSEHQLSKDYLYQLSLNSSSKKISPKNNIDNICKNLFSEKLVSISNNQESADQLNLGFSEQSTHFLNTNRSKIKDMSQYNPNQPEENIYKEMNDEISISLENQWIPKQIGKESLNIHCTDQLTVYESSTNSSNNENISNNFPDIPSADISCTELNDSINDITNDENIPPSNITNTPRIKPLNSDENYFPTETIHSNLNQLSDKWEHNEKTLEILPISEKSVSETNHSFREKMCSIVHNDNTDSDLDIIGKAETNTLPKIDEDQFVNHKDISPIHEKVALSDYSSYSHKSAVSFGDGTEKVNVVKNLIEINSSNSFSNSKYTTENEHPHSTEKVNELDNISNDQNDNTSSKNESVCSLNNNEFNNIPDTIPDNNHISQNIHSLDSILQHNICFSSAEEVSIIGPENNAIFQQNGCRNLSQSERFSVENREEEERNEISNEDEIFGSAIQLRELANETGELDTSSIIQDNRGTDICRTEEHVNKCDSVEPVASSDEVAPNLPKTRQPIISNSHSLEAYLDNSNEEIHDTNDINPDTCQSLSPLSIKNANVNKLSDLESYSQKPILDPFNDTSDMSDCNDDNIDKIDDCYQHSLVDSVSTDLDPDHQMMEDPCTYSDEILFANNNSNVPCNIDEDESLPTRCNAITDIANETGLSDTSNCLNNGVPTLRFLAIKALSRATVNNNLLEVRETPERTEIIFHSEEYCDPTVFEHGDSSNLIMTDTFDDDTHVSPNFEALQEMTFDYSTLPESTSSGYEEKNDEDLPCQCLIISSEESILCLRCSLNSSVDASQFHEMDESCDVSASSIPDDTLTSFDCVEGDCIEQSFIDQEIDFTTLSPVVTYASVDSSPCPPVVENIDESIATEKTQIKVQLPWRRIFNLGGGTNDGDNVESGGVCKQRVLELGPAQIEVRMLSDDCSWWKNSSSSSNSSPVVKVKRLVLQRAAAEAAAAAVEAEESNSTAQNKEQEQGVPASKVELRKGAPRKSRKNIKDDERTLNEILGVPKMVIRKTSCRQYKSYLRTHRILQPVVCLKKNKWLDELALKYQQDGEPLSISADDIDPKPVEQNAVTLELSAEIVAEANKEAEVSQEIIRELNEEATGDVGAKEEIVAGVSEEVVVSREISQEISQKFEEEASAKVGNVEKILDGVSEKVEVSREICLEMSQEFNEEASAEVETIDEIGARVSDEVEVSQQISHEFSEEATVEVRTENDADGQSVSGCENELTHIDVPIHYLDSEIEEVHNTQTDMDDGQDVSAQELTLGDDSLADQENPLAKNTIEKLPQYCSSTNHFLDVKTHLSLRSERHHCMLCHLSYNSVGEYKLHLRSRFHRHLELMQRETVHALYCRFTGRPCPSLRPLSAKERKIMKWKPRNADVNHFYHYKAPLQIALRGDDPVHSSVLFSFASR